MKRMILLLIAVSMLAGLAGCATMTPAEQQQYEQNKRNYLEKNKKWFNCTGSWC